MDNNTKQMLDSVKGLEQSTKNILSQVLTEEVRRELSPEQRELVREAELAFDLSEMNPSDKLTHLQSILKKHGM